MSERGLKEWWASVVAKIRAWIGRIRPNPPQPIPTPTPTTPPVVGDPEGNYDLRLLVTGTDKHNVRFAWEPKRFDWPARVVKVPVCATVEMRRADGRGGKFDWIRVGGQAVKGLENIHNGYGVWGSIGVPNHGERVTFRWVSVDGKRRSNDAPAIWGVSGVAAPAPSPIVSEPAAFGQIKASFLFSDLRDTTLDLLSRHKSDVEFGETVRRCREQGDTHALVYVFNVQDGPRYGWRVPTMPYADGYGGALDDGAVRRMRARLVALRHVRLEPILVLHSDDGGYKINSASCQWHCAKMGQAFGDLCCGAMFGIEADEYLGGSGGEKIEKAGMQAWRNATGKPIAGHYTPGEHKRATRVGADVLFAQFGWLATESQIRAKAKKALAAVAPMPVYAAEYDKSSTRRLGQFAVAQGCAGYLNG